MANPRVREVGHVWDVVERRITVGVDHDAVVVAGDPLDRAQAEEFARLFTAACWEASACAAEMAAYRDE